MANYGLPLPAPPKANRQLFVSQDIRKYYGATKAVDGITFAVSAGEIFGMRGPNGAGKTTTAEIIEGLRLPDAGSVTVLGLDMARHAHVVKTRIGIQIQTTALYPRLNIREGLDPGISDFLHRDLWPYLQRR